MITCCLEVLNWFRPSQVYSLFPKKLIGDNIIVMLYLSLNCLPLIEFPRRHAIQKWIYLCGIETIILLNSIIKLLRKLFMLWYVLRFNSDFVLSIKSFKIERDVWHICSCIIYLFICNFLDYNVVHSYVGGNLQLLCFYCYWLIVTLL